MRINTTHGGSGWVDPDDARELTEHDFETGVWDVNGVRILTPPTRRAALIGAAALAAISRADAAPLGENPVAALFKPVAPGTVLPDAKLISASGPVRLSAWRGKTLLVPLWAEWCGDCLVEMADFAALRRAHGGARFEILPILTAGKKGLDLEAATAVLTRVGAVGLATLIDPPPGDHIAKAFCSDPTSWGHGHCDLPCTLLVDPAGRVTGKAIGLVLAPGRRDKSLWSTPAADAFCAAVARGWAVAA